MDTPATALPRYFALRGGGTLIAVEAAQGGRPAIIYAGCDIPGVEVSELALLAVRQHAAGGPAAPLRASLLNEIGTGLGSAAGLLAHRRGADWAIDLRTVDAGFDGTSKLTLTLKDEAAGIAAQHHLAVHQTTGMLTASTVIENTGEAGLSVDWCAALCLPFDPRLTTFMNFTGKWAHEFAIEEVDCFHGGILRENASGRTSHSSFPGGILKAPETTETAGPAAGFHLAWSGNHRLRIDRAGEGQLQLLAGELLLSGEILLAAGEQYATPDLIACFTESGLNAVSNTFHRHLTEEVMQQRSFAKPRPIHYNTWEAVYFAHDEAVLTDLAQRAADVGAERFVLDDGWFGARRNDRAGLGDWFVSSAAYPNGLGPLVQKVKSLGMEFGLWFEPEMVNPDSELYRSHPDWALETGGAEPVASRNQLTLNLTKPEVCEYLFDRMTALICELEIDYIKLDMNRDTHFPESGGRAVMSAQTRAVYALIDRLRDAHPALEIESCSSGGARADFGVMRRADRIWTSDNNDARQRHRIMRGASHFFPLRVLGNHVGPERCHITGRRFDMAFRVGSAMLGHMGMELDLRAETQTDLKTLKAGLDLHKRHRSLIHGGEFLRLTSSGPTNLVGCVDASRSEALFSYAMLDTQLDTLPSRIVFGGLDPSSHYRVKLVWPQHNPSLSFPSIIDAAQLIGDGQVFSGAALMRHGMQPPLTYPDTCLIYHLKAET
ncbi:alpha-galactosidase [Erythrobacter sp. MTPC3]|uniref:alpha-galactosidase n=1 Tax=Erythrobacter sp. MTPC3 TaxID=3056564 RepID=UPI0036F2F2F7